MGPATGGRCDLVGRSRVSPSILPVQKTVKVVLREKRRDLSLRVSRVFYPAFAIF